MKSVISSQFSGLVTENWEPETIRSRHLDFDLLRLGFGFLFELQLEHTRIVAGLDVLRIDRGYGEREGQLQCGCAEAGVGEEAGSPAEAD